MDYEIEQAKHPDNLLYKHFNTGYFLYSGSLKELNTQSRDKFSFADDSPGKIYYGIVPFSIDNLCVDDLEEKVFNIPITLLKRGNYSGLVNVNISQSVISSNSKEKNLLFIVSGTPVVERSRTMMDGVRDLFHKIIDY